VAGQSLLAHVLNATRPVGGRLAVVVAPDHKDVAAEAQHIAPQAEIYVQEERRGTAHAVLAARDAITRHADDILVVFGDTPLLRPRTLARMREALAADAALVVLGFHTDAPTGYGRLIMDGTQLRAIREEKDATAAERKITLCNGGLVALGGERALEILARIGNDNAKGEFYLTDSVAIARDMGLRVAVIEAEEDEVRGINTKAQLAQADAVMQQRLRAAAMEAGVTLVAPETVFLAADTKFGADVTVEPHVVFGPGVTVGDGATIRSFSHIEGAHIGGGAVVGPFARLRPGTRLGEKVHIGNFVETKAAVIEAGAKANHLTYLGDVHVGENANIGAGTITCNYDGTAKHRTEIGKGAFIGSNTALVAPVSVGDNAYVGSGSVITDDVPANALAIARGRQVVKEDRAMRKREAQPKGEPRAKRSSK
jgi:bifunctional UDP-N-acetylglucosamine pyrophosphorylase/glucosamine-1-phosphate N-acetyltransferase